MGKLQSAVENTESPAQQAQLKFLLAQSLIQASILQQQAAPATSTAGTPLLNGSAQPRSLAAGGGPSTSADG